MEWYKILGLCLSCFSLGISLTGLVFSTLEYRRSAQKLARMDARRAELAKKEKELEDDSTADWELTSRISALPYRCSKCGHRVDAGHLVSRCPSCKHKIKAVKH